jgi:hypothetical protein
VLGDRSSSSSSAPKGYVGSRTRARALQQAPRPGRWEGLRPGWWPAGWHTWPWGMGLCVISNHTHSQHAKRSSALRTRLARKYRFVSLELVRKAGLTLTRRPGIWGASPVARTAFPRWWGLAATRTACAGGLLLRRQVGEHATESRWLSRSSLTAHLEGVGSGGVQSLLTAPRGVNPGAVASIGPSEVIFISRKPGASSISASTGATGRTSVATPTACD